MGVPKRRVSHARQGERRAHLAISAAGPRRMPALPRAEAPAPRLPELRLLRWAPGDRAQADDRRAQVLLTCQCTDDLGGTPNLDAGIGTPMIENTWT